MIMSESISFEELNRALSMSELLAQKKPGGTRGIDYHHPAMGDAGNGYLINEFLSPYTNHRKDPYGKRRELFLLQVIEEISRAIPCSAIIGLRLGCGDYVEGGLEPKDVLRIAGMLPRDRIDYVHTSAGTSDSNDYTIQPIYQPRALLKDTAAAIRNSCGLPVVLTGSVTDPLLADELLAQGAADMIGMGRALLADPQLPVKVQRNTTKQICPCIRCNQGCLGRVREGKTVRCAVNPVLGYGATAHTSRRLHARAAGAASTVLVAGGGPAGITAALRAADMGFSVQLFEEQRQLGGLLNTAKAEPFKYEMGAYLDHLLDRIAGAEVQVALATPVNYDLLEGNRPDVLVDATGSLPAMPQVPPGLPYPVLPVREVLLDLEKHLSCKRVIILGGGSSGCEAALVLSTHGAEVTVIEQESRILRDLEPVSAKALQRLLSNSDAAIQTDTRFQRLETEGVITDRHEAPLSADLVIAALGIRSSATLKSRLDPDRWYYGINYLPVGDAHQVGKIYQAVHDSYWRVTNLLAAMR